jgi:hypothetical protein
MDPDSSCEDCIQVADNLAWKKVANVHYEGRILAVRNWYTKKRKLRIKKEQAQEIRDFQSWQYLHVLPFPYYGLGDRRMFLTNMCIFCICSICSALLGT